MSTTQPVRHLEIVTRDVLRAHEAIRDTFAGHRLRIRGSQDRFRYRQVTATAGPLAVDSLQHTMGVQEDVDPVDHTWVGVLGDRLGVTRGREEIRNAAGDVVLFPQGERFLCEWDVLQLRLVRLPTGEIARRAAARSGTDPADFRFSGMSPVSAALARYCRSTIGYVHSLFAGDDPAIAESLVQAEALDALSAALLAIFPTTAATGPAGDTTPGTVRRTMDFIDAHAAEPIGLADIAQASGIGLRALQEAFRRHRETTPTAYLRQVRLERAHRELQAAEPVGGPTVAAIAARWGFPHRGRFAAAYRQAYGRSPQQTLLS